MSVPPPSARSATTLPPCDSATWRTIASPSPEPGRPRAARRAVEAVEDVREVLVGDPRAVVAHGDLAVARPSTSTCPPGGLHFAALSSRFDDRALDRGRRRRGRATPRGRSRTSTAGRLRRARSTASAATRSSRTSSGPRPARCSSRASSTSSPIERRHLARAARRRRASSRSRSLRRQRSSRASTSMFVRRLVSGVRSSCEASATSWRCARAESSSAREHRVEARREPAQLVVAGRTSMRCERSPRRA